jgi:proline iminopeptidase
VLATFQTGDGGTLSYLRRGAAQLVVCVPGGPGLDPEAYFAPMELAGYELLVFAPRGTGRSSAPASSEGYRIRGYVEDVESLRAHLGLDQLTIYGNSYGGSIALAYACAHPKHVPRLIISAAAGRVDAHYHEAVAHARRRFAENFADGAKRLAVADEAEAAAETDPSEAANYRAFRTAMGCCLAHEETIEAAYLDRLCSAPTNDEATAAMWAEWEEGLDLVTQSHVVSAPALIIAGEADIVVPPATARLIAEALPNARYIELLGVGHFAVVEATEDLCTTICDFLQPPTADP